MPLYLVIDHGGKSASNYSLLVRNIGDFGETPVENSVTFSEAAPFELRLWPVERPIPVMLAMFYTCETIRLGKNLVYMFGVVGPVRRDIQCAAVSESVGDEIEKPGLHDATFVMAFLGPGIREVEVEPGQRQQRDLVGQDFNGVMSDNAQIPETCCIGLQEAMANAGFVDLDTDEVFIRIRGGLLYEGLAIAEADFENDGAGSSEQLTEVEQGRIVLDAIHRPELIERALLGRGDPARTPYEAANRSSCCHGLAGLVANTMGLVFSGQRPSMPA